MFKKTKYKKAVFAPYFGKLPDFFELWLCSAAINDDYTFFVITNDSFCKYNIPNNVQLLFMSFDDFKKRLQDCFDFPITLDTYYKICDYKPVLGAAFKGYLTDFDYWGFCDIDLVFGKLSNFYTDDILDTFFRISDAGHFSLFKCVSETIYAYKQLSSRNCYSYKEVYSSNKSFAFDEWGQNKGFNRIILDNGYDIFYKKILFSDICVDQYALKNTRIRYGSFDSISFETHKTNIIFEFSKEGLFQHYLFDGIHNVGEESYVHFQKRNMKLISSNFVHCLIVPPNKVIDYSDVDALFLSKIKERKIYLHYYLVRLKNLKRKILNGK